MFMIVIAWELKVNARFLNTIHASARRGSADKYGSIKSQCTSTMLIISCGALFANC